MTSAETGASRTAGLFKERTMKLGLGLCCAFALVLGVMTGCALNAEEEERNDQVEQRDDSKSASEEESVGQSRSALTSCPPPAMCAKAFSTCPNPRLGGSMCYVADQCVRCRL